MNAVEAGGERPRPVCQRKSCPSAPMMGRVGDRAYIPMCDAPMADVRPDPIETLDAYLALGGGDEPVPGSCRSSKHRELKASKADH